MSSKTNYLEINRTSWNARTTHHITSEFYDVKGFLEGNTSLKSIELELLGDVKGRLFFICNATLVKTLFL